MRMMVSMRALTAALLLVLAGAVFAQDGAIRNRGEPMENVTTGGQPDAVALQTLADSGYAAVIDLRRPEEDRGIDEQSEVEGLGMSYISIPVDGADGVTYENAALLDKILGETEGPVLIHCGSGNRAGALLALREKLNGADNESALAVGRAGSLTGLEPVVRERLESGP